MEISKIAELVEEAIDAGFVFRSEGTVLSSADGFNYAGRAVLGVLFDNIGKPNFNLYFKNQKSGLGLFASKNNPLTKSGRTILKKASSDPTTSSMLTDTEREFVRPLIDEHTRHGGLRPSNAEIDSTSAMLLAKILWDFNLGNPDLSRFIGMLQETHRGESKEEHPNFGENPSPDIKSGIVATKQQATGDPDFSGAISEKPYQSKTTNVEKQELPTKWLDFYTYVMIPLSIVKAVVSAFLQYKEGAPMMRVLVVAEVLDILMIVPLFIGLHRRRLWGWKYNWVMLVLVTLARPLLVAKDMQMYFLGVMSFAFIWFLPNFIYFRNRRYLFK